MYVLCEPQSTIIIGILRFKCKIPIFCSYTLKQLKLPDNKKK